MISSMRDAWHTGRVYFFDFNVIITHFVFPETNSTAAASKLIVKLTSEMQINQHTQQHTNKSVNHQTLFHLALSER